MTDLPAEVRDLIESGHLDFPESEPTGEGLLINEVATLATAPSKWHRCPNTESRDTLIRNYRHIKETKQSSDDALPDHLRRLRIQRDEVEQSTTLLLTYARTVPARDRKYPLRELAEVSGIPISSIRDRISEAGMEEIEGLLNLDDERLSRLDSERDKKGQP